MTWSNEQMEWTVRRRPSKAKEGKEQNNFNIGGAYGFGLKQGLCMVQSAAIVHIRIEMKSASIATLK